MMGGFGGAYKKQPTTKHTGKTQELVVKSNGLEQCDRLWHDIFELFKDSPFQSASDPNLEKYLQNVLAANWLTGLDAKASFLSTNPNGLGCFRFLSAGEVCWALFDLIDLLAVYKCLGEERGTLDALYDSLKVSGEENIKLFAEKGCKVRFTVQKSGELLYVPTGWVAAENVKSGLLVYGLRKTVLYRSPRAAEGYEHLIGLHSKSGKPVDKMQATLAFMNPAESS